MAVSRKLPPSKAVLASVADVLVRHVPPGARLALALSGGLDSMALLHVLIALRDDHPFTLQAVHVHHGLSPHADAWADFCAHHCALHGVTLAVHHVTVARDDAAGFEAAARRLRHAIFAKVDADFLLTAHQEDDQAETLLLQLLRGAGPKGLAAMPELQRRPAWRAVQLRPLLGISRARLRDYVAAHALEWVEDDSNVDVRYRRNALRQEIMPRLAVHFPGSTATLARAAGLQAEAAELLDDLARIDAAAAVTGARLDCAVLAELTPARARNLLRHFIARHGLSMPQARQLDEALRQLLAARHDARVQVNLGPWLLWRFRGGAYLVPPLPPPAPPVRWRGEAALWVPAAGVTVAMQPVTAAGLARAALESGVVTLGTRTGGERMQLTPGGPHRSLKKLMQEHAVPPWQRACLPLLWCDGRLAWVHGIGIDAAFRAGPREAGIQPTVLETPSGRDSERPRVLS